MKALTGPAARAGIVIPRVRDSDLADDPPWVMFDLLPGVPVPASDRVGSDRARFPQIARAMGELLASFRSLPTDELKVDDLWADPAHLAARAESWANDNSLLTTPQRKVLAGVIGITPRVVRRSADRARPW